MLEKHLPTSISQLWEVNFEGDFERSLNITILAKENLLQGYLNGVSMFAVKDEQEYIPKGHFGFISIYNDTSSFSKARVYPIETLFNQWLLHDSFEFLDLNQWTFESNIENSEVLPEWEVIDGRLNYRGSSLQEKPRHDPMRSPEIYAIAGENTWTNYRISARIKVGQSDNVGIVVRYIDSNNYYRLVLGTPSEDQSLLNKVSRFICESLNEVFKHTGFKKLTHKHLYSVNLVFVKVIQGKETTLQEYPIKLDINREHILTIDCFGDQFLVYVDGIPQKPFTSLNTKLQTTAVSDSSISSGKIGLYTHVNSDIAIAEISVASPIWQNYYSFSQEENMPAGTKVQVVSGNQLDSQSKKPNITQRFVATGDSSGQVHWPNQKVDIRLVTPGEKIGHTKRFVNDFSLAKDAKILRNADGTSFILVPQAAQAASQITGQYRLEFSYRLDNRSVDPKSQIFRQNNDTSSEDVVIDVPGL